MTLGNEWAGRNFKLQNSREDWPFWRQACTCQPIGAQGAVHAHLDDDYLVLWRAAERVGCFILKFYGAGAWRITPPSRRWCSRGDPKAQGPARWRHAAGRCQPGFNLHAT